MSIDTDELIFIAKKAALDAGQLLAKNRSNLNKNFLSTDKDIKLKADLAAEEKILKTISTNSDIPILSEETGITGNISDVFWVVDPLDGTANYSRNIPISCVSIAVVANSLPIMGVVYDFNNNELYEGSINSKAFLNQKKISVSNIKEPSEGILITGLPNDTDYSDKTLLSMVKNFQNWRKVRMIGSASMASMYIATGKADLYTENKSYLWDVAAGAAIVNAAGGEAIIKNKNEKFQVDVRFSNSIIKSA